MSNQELAAAAKKRGNGHYSKSEWDKAIEEYTKAIELYDKDHTYFSNRSACYAASGKFDEALSDGQTCVTLKPDFVKGYGRVGYALFKLEKLNEAKEAYEKGLTIDGENSTLKDGLAECEQAMNPDAKGGDAAGGGGGGMFGPQIWQTISLDPELRPFMSDKDFVAKINMLNTNPQMAMQMGILTDPKIKKVFEKLMGMSFGDKDDMKSSETDAQSSSKNDNPYANLSSDAKEKTPTPPPPKEASPELTEEEKVEREQERLEKEKQLKLENDALEFKKKGNDFYKKQEFDLAISEYRKAQELDIKKASYVLNESAALFMKQDWDACLECCLRAVEVSREHFCDLIWTHKAFVRAGSVEEKRGNIAEAVDYYNKALTEQKDDKLKKKVRKLLSVDKKKKEKALYDPELAEKLKSEGNDLFGKGNFLGAIEKYTESLKRDPKNHKVYSNRATCFCKVMRWDAAIADCDTAIKLDPTFIKAYIRKGKIQHCIKQYHKALECFKLAEAIDPTVDDLIISKRDTMMAIQQRNYSGKGITEEERQRAMQDPKVQQALQDPEVSSVLLQAQSGDPTILYKAMRDRPHIKEKIELLMAAGVLRTGPAQ